MPESPSPFQLGNQLLARRNVKAAASEFRRHMDLYPDERPKALARLAVCYLRSDMLIESMQITTDVKLVFQGDRGNAEACYREALSIDSAHYESLLGLARLLPLKSEERLMLLEKAVAKQRKSSVLTDLGDAYRTLRKDYHQAYLFYREAVEVMPTDRTAYDKLNDVCRRLGRVDEAKKWIERWREVNATRRAVARRK